MVHMTFARGGIRGGNQGDLLPSSTQEHRPFKSQAKEKMDTVFPLLTLVFTYFSCGLYYELKALFSTQLQWLPTVLLCKIKSKSVPVGTPEHFPVPQCSRDLVEAIFRYHISEKMCLSLKGLIPHPLVKPNILSS